MQAAEVGQFHHDVQIGRAGGLVDYVLSQGILPVLLVSAAGSLLGYLRMVTALVPGSLQVLDVSVAAIFPVSSAREMRYIWCWRWVEVAFFLFAS